MTAILAFAWANALTIASWAIRIGAFVVVPFRRSAAEARTWLLMFFVVPIPALIVYLVIGRPEHSKKRKKLFAKLPAVLGRVVKKAGLDGDRTLAELPERYRAIASLAEGLGKLAPLSGNAIELLPDYDGTIDRLAEDIDGATHHVHLEFYIFANDETGHKIIGALERAEARGVQCRVLIDAMGSYKFARRTEKRLEKSGIEVHRILPLARRLNSSRIDLRNHRKIAVIDGQIGYTGSQNVVDSTISKELSNKELMCRITGPAVGALQIVFLGDWYLETQQEPDESELFAMADDCGDICMQAVPSGPDYKGTSIDMVFTDMIHQAREEIVLVTPYFIPNEALVCALVTAARRGVTVKLVLSEKLDSKLVDLAQRSYYAGLLKAGVAIFLYQADFLHAKHLRIDTDIALIGSSNMDLRSFELNAEISLICYGEDTATKIRAIEQDYIDHARTIEAEAWSQRPLPRKMLENCARLMSDLL